MQKNKKLEALTDAEVKAVVEAEGSINAAADKLGIPRTTFKRRVRDAFKGDMRSQRMPAPVVVEAPTRGKTCFIFSSAQTNTEIDEAFLENLEAYAEYLGASIHISGFAYATSPYDDHSKHGAASFHERVRPYLTNQRFDVAGKLYFCGEMNTQPTATDPLSGFETYTRSRWGIFPHPRITLKSIATMFKADPKIIMTTGAVTKPNYIQKKSGLKAEFHHVIAAVLVEIDADGRFFCRHLIAAKDGSFQDLDARVEGGAVSRGHPVEGIVWGDIHAERLDPHVAVGAWGVDAETMEMVSAQRQRCMLDVLSPKYQFFHDVLDFRRRNHHNVGDPHFRFESMVRGRESVKDEIAHSALFLANTRRLGCTSVVVDSNHDRALMRWLKSADYKSDPANARFFLDCQARVYRAIEEQDDSFKIVQYAMESTGHAINGVVFLKNTDSFIICEHAGGGIECGLHGDEGSNGAKGHVNSYAKMGPKANVAHHHGAEIFEGIYQAGHSCQRDMVYNRGGLSSWNPSHIVVYPNGKRVIVTMQGQKWRA